VVTLRRVMVGAGSMSLVVLSLAYVVGAPRPVQAAAVRPPVEEFAAEFAGSSGVTPLSDPAVGSLIPASAQTSEMSSGSPAPPSAPDSGGRMGLASDVTGSPQGDQREAVRWLKLAVEAPDAVAYDGVRVVTSYDNGHETQLAIGIQHVPGRGTRYEVAGTGLRKSTATFVTQREADNNGLESQHLGLLLADYHVSMDGTGVVAGRPSTVVVASLNGEVLAKFWIDDATGLLLQRQMYDNERLVRSSSFLTLRTLKHGYLTHPTPVLDAPNGIPVATSTLPVLNDEGWTCPEELPSEFQLLFMHRLNSPREVLHATYTDGLSTLSVFEEPGRLDPSRLQGFQLVHRPAQTSYMRYGVPTVVVWGADNRVYTVVTDAPDPVLQSVLARFPRQQPAAPGGVDRVATGLGRIGSYIVSLN
ncbi:MAG: hypothetical protein ACRDWW_03470, partial [Acidimicrobiales bacterium]